MRHQGSRESGRALDTGVQLVSVLDQLIRARVEEVVRSVRDEDEDPLVRSDRLGPNNRIVLGLIKRGEIRGVLIGNRWHVRRSEWARYVAKLEAAQGSEREGTSAGRTDDDDDADRVLASLGFERRTAIPRPRADRSAISARPGCSRQPRKNHGR